jgi:hypothetical protein
MSRGRLLSSSSILARSRGMDAQVRRLWEVLAQQPVGVLVRAALPRAGGVTEVDLRTDRRGDLAVAGHLGALVPGQALAQLDR